MRQLCLHALRSLTLPGPGGESREGGCVPSPCPSPTLLACCEIADNHPNHTICPRHNCCQVLTEIDGQPGTNFSHRGEKSTPHTVHIHSTHIYLAPFEFCGRIFGQRPSIRKSPIRLPNTPSSIYAHIIAHNLVVSLF